MLLRMGAVVWWFGAIVGLLFMGVAARNETYLWSCASTLETMADVERSEALAAAKASDQALKAGVQVDKYAAGLGLEGAPPLDPRDTDALRTDARRCKTLWSPLVFLAAAAGFSAALWSLAFILGGSFWRPPSVRATGSQALAR